MRSTLSEKGKSAINVRLVSEETDIFHSRLRQGDEKTAKEDEFALIFNKPYGVLCQFSGLKPNLSEFIPLKGFYPAGRLDKASEGLVVLTNSGAAQALISNPNTKWRRHTGFRLRAILTTSA